MLLIEPLDFTGGVHVALSMVRQSARLNLSESLRNIRLSELHCLGVHREANSGQACQSALVKSIPLRPSAHFANSD